MNIHHRSTLCRIVTSHSTPQPKSPSVRKLSHNSPWDSKNHKCRGTVRKQVEFCISSDLQMVCDENRLNSWIVLIPANIY
jgi:hypothetical protein